jgi:glycosyltransferase involved in cell wall biosynthesis
MIQKNILASILINNYNNEKFIRKCLKSCLNQSYKNIEIIIYDDVSNDGSSNYIKYIKSNKIRKIFNNKKISKSGPLNQLKAIQKSFLKSKGEIIFLLDGDDAFLKNKVKYFVNIFRKKKKLEFIQDNPIYFYPDNLKKEKKIIKSKKFILNTWPYFNPTSTMVFRRNFLKKLFNEIKFSNNKFQKMFFDARAIIYIYFFSENYLKSNKHLTIYTQNIKGDTIYNYGNKTLIWWERRLEYHKFVECLFTRKKKNYNKYLDYYLTLIVNKIYKILNKI